MNIEELALSDAHIVSVNIDSTQVTVTIEDWQERLLTLLFVGVCGLEALLPLEMEIEYAETDNTDSFLDKACTLQQRNRDEMNCYIFYDSWHSKAILKIVAGTFGYEYQQASSSEVSVETS